MLCLPHNATATEQEPLHLSPLSELNWETTPEGVAFAALEGNRFTQPYIAMVRLPAGTVSLVHKKTAAMFGVVVSGEMTHASDDQGGKTLPRLAQGAYYKIPAGVAHVSACVSSTECITFLYQDGAFDFLPVAQ
jgi:hypothetical protein